MDFKALFNTLTLTSAIILAGCSAGLEETEENNAMSTFSVSPISTSSDDHILDSNWGIATKSTFIATACLKDRAYAKSIIGQTFKVADQTVVSNDSGCINWNDSVKFDFFAPEEDKTITRKITGLGDYTGEFTASFIYNPWTKSEKKIATFKSSSSSAAIYDVSNKKTLAIGNVSVKNYDESSNGSSASVPFKISFTPLHRRLAKNDTMTPGSKFSKGNFVITAVLYEQSNGKYTALSTPKTFNVSINESTNMIDTTVELDMFNRASADNSRVFLGLRVSPEANTAPKYLSSLEGFVTLKSNLTMKDGAFNTTNSLPEVAFNAAFEKSTTADKFGFDIKTPTISLAGYPKQQLDSDAIKTMETKIKFCLNNYITRLNVKELAFDVQILDEDKNVVFEVGSEKANTSGCITSFFTLDFDLNAPRNSNDIKHHLRVIGAEGKYEGITRDRVFYINPFEKGKNYSITKKGKLPTIFEKVQNSKLYTKRFSIAYKGNDANLYRINRQMEMSFVKEFRVNFTPEIDRGIKYSSSNSYEPMMNGKLKMRLMVLAPKFMADKVNPNKLISASKARSGSISESELSNYKFITGTEEIVEFSNGKVIKDIKLKFDTNNIKYVSTKSYVVVEISSADENNAVQPMIFTIPAMLASTRSNSAETTTDTLVNVDIRKLNANNKLNAYFANIANIELDKPLKSHILVDSMTLFDSIVKKDENIKTYRGLKEVTYMGWPTTKNFYAIKKKQRMQLLNREEFDYISNLNKTENSDQIEYISPVSWLFPKTDMMVSLVKKFCNFYYEGHNAERNVWGNRITDEGRCRKNPEKYLSFASHKYVLDITKQPVDGGRSTSGSFSLSAGNNTRANKSFSKYWGWRADWGVKLDTFGLEALGIKSGGGIGASYGHGWSNGESTGESVNLSQSLRLDLETIELEFEAKTRSCVLINSLHGKKRGIRLCEKEDKLETIKENWYMIVEPWRRRAFMADSHDLNVFKLIRGKHRFVAFKNLLEDTNNMKFLSPVHSRTDMTQYLEGLYDTSSGERPTINDDSFFGLIE